MRMEADTERRTTEIWAAMLQLMSYHKHAIVRDANECWCCLLLFRHNNVIPMKSWSKALSMQTIVYFCAAHTFRFTRFFAIPLHSIRHRAKHSLVLPLIVNKYTYNIYMYIMNIFAPMSNQMQSHDPWFGCFAKPTSFKIHTITCIHNRSLFVLIFIDYCVYFDVVCMVCNKNYTYLPFACVDTYNLTIFNVKLSLVLTFS